MLPHVWPLPSGPQNLVAPFLDLIDSRFFLRFSWISCVDLQCLLCLMWYLYVLLLSDGRLWRNLEGFHGVYVLMMRKNRKYLPCIRLNCAAWMQIPVALNCECIKSGKGGMYVSLLCFVPSFFRPRCLGLNDMEFEILMKLNLVVWLFEMTRRNNFKSCLESQARDHCLSCAAFITCRTVYELACFLLVYVRIHASVCEYYGLDTVFFPSDLVDQILGAYVDKCRWNITKLINIVWEIDEEDYFYSWLMS